MKKSIAKESPRRRMARRVGAAGVALATTLVLAGCHEAHGGGYIGAPIGWRRHRLQFRRCKLRLQLHVRRRQVKGQITYHDDPSTISSRDSVALQFPETQAPRHCGERPDRVPDDPTTEC